MEKLIRFHFQRPAPQACTQQVLHKSHNMSWSLWLDVSEAVELE